MEKNEQNLADLTSLTLNINSNLRDNINRLMSELEKNPNNEVLKDVISDLMQQRESLAKVDIGLVEVLTPGDTSNRSLASSNLRDIRNYNDGIYQELNPKTISENESQFLR